MNIYYAEGEIVKILTEVREGEIVKVLTGEGEGQVRMTLNDF